MKREQFAKLFLARWLSTETEEGTFDLVYDMIDAMTAAKVKPEKAPTPESRAVLDAYYQAYLKRYKFRPPVTPIMVKHCKTLVQKVGALAAVAVVEEYLLSNDSFHVNRRHDISFAVSSAGELSLRAEARQNGVRGPTQAEAKTRGVLNDNIDAVKSYLGDEDGPADLP